jgi:type VI secretion system secreted protein VgrG
MVSASTRPVKFSFVSQAKGLSLKTFKVAGFEGTEEISRPYRFDIDLVAGDPDLDPEELLYQPAYLKVVKGDHERKIHGVICECRLSELPDQCYLFHVVLRPWIWLFSLNRRNRIRQNMTVPQIIEEWIRTEGKKVADFEMNRPKQEPCKSRAYTVQYGESDFDFISRLMEHEGIFYFFEQGAQREKMIIADKNARFGPDPTEIPVLPYRPASGQSRSSDEAILSFTCTHRCTPGKVILKDYNYLSGAGSIIQKERRVHKRAQAFICEYGDHLQNADEGTALALIRAQELKCAMRTFAGDSDSLRLQPGWRFRMSEHSRKTFNAEYVVTALAHRGRQPVQTLDGLAQGCVAQATYDNQLVCIPAEVDYRPPRRTHRPLIPGLITAHVDSAAEDARRAEIDDQGRYKLVMPFDVNPGTDGKLFSAVRKAQPYGGSQMGMHFPLLKGTEVVCSFNNGDPDRPIIVGAIPCQDNQSVVTAGNHTRNVIKTASGVLLEINDGTPSPNSGQGG